jgi:hypothetical protein
LILKLFFEVSYEGYKKDPLRYIDPIYLHSYYHHDLNEEPKKQKEDEDITKKSEDRLFWNHKDWMMLVLIVVLEIPELWISSLGHSSLLVIISALVTYVCTKKRFWTFIKL